jgi:hypothetical protein
LSPLTCRLTIRTAFPKCGRTASPKPAAQVSAHHARVSLNRFDLNGYVINAKYTLGRNTGNTFQQTYTITVVKCGKDPLR